MVDKLTTWTERVTDQVGHLIDSPVNSVIKHDIDMEYWVGLVFLHLSSELPEKSTLLQILISRSSRCCRCHGAWTKGVGAWYHSGRI